MTAQDQSAEREAFERWYDAQPEGRLNPFDVFQAGIEHAVKAGHACVFALDHGGNLYRRYREPKCTEALSAREARAHEPNERLLKIATRLRGEPSEHDLREAASLLESVYLGEAPAREGWQLVPKELTAAMIDAFHLEEGESAYNKWDALLAAAPQAPTTEGGEK